MIRLFTALTLLALPTTATLAIAAERCKTTLVRTHVDGQPRVETTRLCVDDETRPSAQPEPGFLISESCLKSKCLAYEGASKIRAEVGKSNPFAKRFALCTLHGGRAEVIEFQWNGRWQPSDRCVFEKDHSFVDTMSLVGLGRFFNFNGITGDPDSFKRRANRKAPEGNSGARDRKR